MSKLNKLSGNYKGGTGYQPPSNLNKLTEEEKINNDIKIYIETLTNYYYDNTISKKDLLNYKNCIEAFSKENTPDNQPTNPFFIKLIAFTKTMLELNKINKTHLTQQIEGIDNILKTTYPKIIDTKPSPKTDGQINSLSSGYKKK